MASAANPFIFPVGDIRILATYKEKPIVGMVSSHAMLLASPVWRNFIFPPWEVNATVINEPAILSGPSKPTGSANDVKQIDFSEDDGEALLILLNIAHLKLKAVPKTLQYHELLQVAKLIDQYQCVQLVDPWVEAWLQKEAVEPKKFGQEGWLFIAWVFGREDTFKSLAVDLTKGSRFINGSLAPLFNIAFPEPMPMGIMENMTKVRNQTAQKLLDLVYSELSRYQFFTSMNVKQCRGTSLGSYCDSLVYGSLALALFSNGLLPLKKPEELSVSLNMLASTIGNMDVLGIAGINEELKSHDDCGLKRDELHAKVQTIMKSMEDPVLDCHRVHMRIQRGLPADGDGSEE